MGRRRRAEPDPRWSPSYRWPEDGGPVARPGPALLGERVEPAGGVAITYDGAAPRIDDDAIHRRLGNGWWPPRWGTLHGVVLDERGPKERVRRILVSLDREIGGRERGGGVGWVHASISRMRAMPTYADLKLLHRAVFGDGWAYQVFTPAAEHISIHAFALHLFGRIDGEPVLPDFTHRGEI